MKKQLRIVMAQLNFTVGDLQGNLVKHIEAAKLAHSQMQADVIVFPELSLSGYPPEDLLLRPAFIKGCKDALSKAMEEIKNIYFIIGHPHEQHNHLYNASSCIYNGELIGQYFKHKLPNYGVFDEERYFSPGEKTCVFDIHGIRVGLIICEDLWTNKLIPATAAQGARLIFIPNASPFEINKFEQRKKIIAERTKNTALPIIYVNLVGGQDELLFDGGSMAISAHGEINQCAGFFNEVLYPVDVSVETKDLHIAKIPYETPSSKERIYQALVLGLKDYVVKNNFPGVLLGLSGGIDSALTLAIAVDAIGKDKVKAILMPSRYTANFSIDDAVELAHKLGVHTEIISIEHTFQAFLDSLDPVFANQKTDVTEENIQARCRAVILMALSNKFGDLVLTTGNRSEYAVGYCTLYGDMAGGFAVLKDVYKTLVYELAQYRNSLSPVIPERILTRPPSAELAPDQRDEDILPPYEVLDKILAAYLDESEDEATIVQQGYAAATVHKIVQFIRRNEYKRRQAAIGTRINHKSFGRDWRYPITNGWKG